MVPSESYCAGFFTELYCAGVSNKHCLLTFFIYIDKQFLAPEIIISTFQLIWAKKLKVSHCDQSLSAVRPASVNFFFK